MSNPISEALLPDETKAMLANVRERVVNYVSKMAPGVAISDADGATQQKLLWTGVLMYVMNLPATQFEYGWGEFLKLVQEHRKGAFSLAYVNRFQANLLLTLPERRNFQRLMHLAEKTCDPKARPLGLKQIDMRLILAGLPSEPVRQKFIAFYQI
ncbi:permease of the drug/metabolite transporter (DMT) superfamily [Xanthomonas phage vB_XciM_LucasX]|nr:permease of the drug/metabolite transporter (DMT) superfamily [Xanthomonas phage vB_XciM_LucasX]